MTQIIQADGSIVDAIIISKSVELCLLLNEETGELITTTTPASRYDYLERIVPRRAGRPRGYDVIAGWSEGQENNKYIYLGHWNGGTIVS